MTNKETIERITKYQNCGYVHPLTCGNDSRHNVLKAVEKDGKVILVCPDCDYVQAWVPDFSVTDLPPDPLAGFKL